MTIITCPKCDRQFLTPKTKRNGNLSRAAYCYVVHDYYGCDTGCCGHIGYLCDDNNEILDEHFVFVHNYLHEDNNKWIQEFLSDIWPKIPIHYNKCNVGDD